MIMDALRWYVEGLSAFWVSLAGGGLLKLILICALIYWVFCRRGRCHRHRCGCPHCGCPSGHCSCGGDEAEDGGEAGVGTVEDAEPVEETD